MRRLLRALGVGGFTCRHLYCQHPVFVHLEEVGECLIPGCPCGQFLP